VLPSGRESATSPEPIILLKCRIVFTLTVINSTMVNDLMEEKRIVFPALLLLQSDRLDTVSDGRGCYA